MICERFSNARSTGEWHANLEGAQGPPGARLPRPADRGGRRHRLNRGRSGGRSFPRAPARAGTRRSSCATPRTFAMADSASCKALENVTREIAPALVGMELDDQAAVDAKLIALDGTPNKSRLVQTRFLAFPWPSPTPPPRHGAKNCSFI